MIIRHINNKKSYIRAPIFVEKLSEKNDAVLQRHFLVEKLSENNDAVLQRHFFRKAF